MFGFKRKKDENVSLIPKKESIFSKIKAFFSKNENDNEEYYSNQSFYSKHSYVVISKGNSEEDVFHATLSMDGSDSYTFEKMKEIGLMHHEDGKSTKLVVADFSHDSEEGKDKDIRKICFEIPNYYSVDEFLYHDGLYELGKSCRLKFEDLNYYEVTPIGRAEMKADSKMEIQISIEDNTNEATEYAKNVLTNEWLKRMKKDNIAKQKNKKQEEKKEIDRMYEESFIDNSKYMQKEEEETQNRINDNNIRIAPGKTSIYFTDPDNGKIVCLARVTKLNTVIHKDSQITTNLYIADYTAKKNYLDVPDSNKKGMLAFELTEDEMKKLLKNRDDSLNLAFRMLFSEKNVSHYMGADSLGNKHVGCLKDTVEGYKVLLGSNISKSYLDSLNIDRYNTPMINPVFSNR